MKQWEKEQLIVKKTRLPITKHTLIQNFQKIGLKPSDIVIVHTAMSKLGWVVGGAVTVIEALMETLTEEGTLVMPTLTTGNTEPSGWNYPPVPKEWWPIIREEMPPYRPEITPTRGMGRIPELFRTFPKVCRSGHPQVSFAAWGKCAQTIVMDHPLAKGFGDNSPLEKLYQLNAKILLMGVGHESNTSLHYAEWKADLPNFPKFTQGAAVLENGKRVWKTWEDLEYDVEDFPAIGTAYETSINYLPQKIGLAESRLLSMKELVDFAVNWLKTHRRYPKDTN